MASSTTADSFDESEYIFMVQNKICQCEDIVDVRITKSNENNNCGKLYYVCANGLCSFRGWCMPQRIESKVDQNSNFQRMVIKEIKNMKQKIAWHDKVFIFTLMICVYLFGKYIMW